MRVIVVDQQFVRFSQGLRDHWKWVEFKLIWIDRVSYVSSAVFVSAGNPFGDFLRRCCELLGIGTAQSDVVDETLKIRVFSFKFRRRGVFLVRTIAALRVAIIPVFSVLRPTAWGVSRTVRG